MVATSVLIVIAVAEVTEVSRELELRDPASRGEGNAVLGTILLQTSANACSSFVFSSGIFGVCGAELAEVVVVGVVVVKVMHVLMEGIMGIMGMTTGRRR